MSLWERLTAFNTRMNGIPRKFGLIALVLICCYLVVFLFPLFAPFLIAGIIAWLMNPLVRFLRKIMGKFKFKKSVSTFLAMVLVYGVVSVVSVLLLRTIISELISLARSMPNIVRVISTEANELVQALTENYAEYLPENFNTLISTSLSELTKSLMNFATTILRSATGGAFATALSLPEMILTVVLTIMGTFYLSYDKERIFAFFRRAFPKQVVDGAISLKNNLLSAVFGQVKSQILVSLLITITVTVGLIVMRRPYGLVMGLLIGIGDALPVIGAGLFLITWAILAFVLGETGIGIGMLVLYLLTILVRQIFEPRIVGKNLGLYPLATMMALYAGFKLMGVLGMLAGPIVLNILKVVLAADEGLLQRVKKEAGDKNENHKTLEGGRDSKGK